MRALHRLVSIFKLIFSIIACGLAEFYRCSIVMFNILPCRNFYASIYIIAALLVFLCHLAWGLFLSALILAIFHLLIIQLYHRYKLYKPALCN